MTKKFLYSLTLICFFTGYIFAQNRPPKDSLLAVWQDKSLADSIRLEALHTINHYYYMQSQPDTAIVIANFLIEEAEKAGVTVVLGRAENTIGVANWMLGNLEEAIPHLQVAQKHFEAIGELKGAAGCLINTGILLNGLGKLEEAEASLKAGIELCKQIDDYEFRINGTINLGVLYLDQGYNDKALPYFEEALALLEEHDNPQARTGILINMGIIQFNRGNFDVAIDRFTESMHTAEANNIPHLTLFNLSWLAMAANELKEPEQALDYVERAMVILEQIGNNSQLTELLTSKANALSQLGKKDEALAAYQETARLAKEMGVISRYANALGNVGAIHADNGDYQQAIDNYNESLRIGIEIKDINQQYISLLNLGNAYHNLGDLNKALDHKLQAYELAEPLKNVNSLKEISHSLYMTHAALGQHKKALNMLELHMANKDSIEKEANKKAIIVQQYKFEAEKEAALTAQRHEDQLLIEAQQQQNQRIVIWAVIGGLLFAIAFAVLLFKRLKLTRVQKDAIAEARDKAEESERFKEQFLANMSHEIRTPMHAISGMTKILLRNQPEKSQMKFLDAIQQSSDNLLVILNDILDLSKIEAGKLDVESIPIRPAAIAHAVFDVMRFKAEEQSLKLVLDLQIDEKETVVGDPTRLSQILINLVGNAIKFTKKGDVKVTVAIQGEHLRYVVQDSGIGIPVDKVDKIFASFEQIDETTTRKFGGTGLGLSITRQLVELQNGNIWVESEEGKGSSFFVELPYVAADEAASADTFNEEELLAMGKDMEGLRLLLAEDNPFNVMVATDDLEYYIPKIQITHADNGQVAIDQSKNGVFDIILMDVQMPEVNGLEAAEQIRRTTNGSAIPIIAMTASLLKKEIDRCYAAGMQDYIPKPYTSQQFIPVIHKHLVSDKAAHQT